MKRGVARELGWAPSRLPGCMRRPQSSPPCEGRIITFSTGSKAQFPCLQSLRLLFPLSCCCCPSLPTNSRKSLGENLRHSIKVLSVLALRPPPPSLFSVPLLHEQHLEVDLGGSCLHGCRCPWKLWKEQGIKCSGIATPICSDTFHLIQLTFAETQGWALQGDAQRRQGWTSRSCGTNSIVY